MKTTILLSLLFILSFFSVAQDKPPVANDDLATAIAGIPISVNVMINDATQEGDTSVIYYVDAKYGTATFQDSIITYTSEIYLDRTDSVKYLIKDINNGLVSEFGYLILTIENHSFGWLDINDIRARFNAWGGHFWDYYNSGVHFYVPGNSKKGSMFCSTLWVGGNDENGNLHLAAERYRQVGVDYFIGPVSDSYDEDYLIKWQKMWSLSRQEIEDHRANWWKPDYIVPEEIATWPAHGDESQGQTPDIAPYYDYDGDGHYDPMQGDYPVIRGDKTLFFVFNDARDAHTETQGRKMGMQVNAMAYAFDCPQDSALKQSLFLHYTLINTSDTTYYDTYTGMFADFDLGNPWDDYFGSDVEQNSIYVYNGDDDDDPAYPAYYDRSYGPYPPAQSLTMLGGPFMDPDGEDNPSEDLQGEPLCDFSVNGLNFSDGIVDNERLGMTNSMCFSNNYSLEPYHAFEYYNMLHSIWADNKHLKYGSSGYSGSDTIGTDCRFVYPGNSDTLNWGTDCMLPLEPFNQPGVYWDEEIVGNAPSDRRGILSSGPFTFAPGDKHAFDIALVFARDYQDPSHLASRELLRNRIAIIHQYFRNDSTPCGSSFSNILKKPGQTSNIVLFPNPSLSGISPGLYFMHLINNGKPVTKKFIRIP